MQKKTSPKGWKILIGKKERKKIRKKIVLFACIFPGPTLAPRLRQAHPSSALDPLPARQCPHVVASAAIDDRAALSLPRRPA